MSTMETMTPSADEATVRWIREQLFTEPRLNVYAILDGASVPGLLDRLAVDVPEYVCLYAGKLAPVLAEVAPYLVRLRPEDRFTGWVLRSGWLRHWGIFVLSAASLPQLRNHFRRFLIVHDHQGRRLYFRYYDPRVLQAYLPTCNEEERNFVFGPVAMYACENVDTGDLVFLRGSGQ